MSKYDETIDETSFEELEETNEYENRTHQTPNRRSRRQSKKNKGKALKVAIILSTGAILALLAKHGIDERADYSRALRLTNAYQTGAYCIIPERIYTSQNHDFNYTSGKHIVEAADKKDIDILKIGDTFITEDASPVARVLLEVQTVEAVDIIKCESNGQEFYIEPEGYVWNNNTQKCERITTEIVERYVYANAEHNYLNTRVPGSTVISVISYEEYPSISYEEAKKMEIVADVNDDYVKTESDTVTQARLLLVPDNKNN